MDAKTARRKADETIKRMSSAKLDQARKNYNAEYKRKALAELKRRGYIKTRRRTINPWLPRNPFS